MMTMILRTKDDNNKRVSKGERRKRNINQSNDDKIKLSKCKII